MVDDRALVLPQQETEASKEVHFELPSAVALVPDVVGTRVLADDLVPCHSYSRGTRRISRPPQRWG